MIDQFDCLMNARFIWPAWSRMVDGRIIVKTTGYEAGHHWTGEQTVGLMADEFWSWFYANRDLFPPVMNESLLPKLKGFWAREISEEQLIHGTLAPPSDGNYISRRHLTPSGIEALGTLFSRYGRDAFISISDAELGSLTMKLLEVFCAGHGEVFCFRKGRCDYFAALGEAQQQLNQHLALLDKRIPQCPIK